MAGVIRVGGFFFLCGCYSETTVCLVKWCPKGNFFELGVLGKFSLYVDKAMKRWK